MPVSTSKRRLTSRTQSLPVKPGECEAWSSADPVPGSMTLNCAAAQDEILTHEETLQLLSEMAKAGSVTAAVALARELRLDPGEEEDELDDELERLLRRDG